MVDYSKNPTAVYSDNETADRDWWNWLVSETMREAVAREFGEEEKQCIKQTPDNSVDHPSYYNSGSIEAIEVIDDWDLGFCLGNAVKYIARAGKKNPEKKIEDLEKAIWYIQHEIEKVSHE